jgi:hypothetical protein
MSLLEMREMRDLSSVLASLLHDETRLGVRTR